MGRICLASCWLANEVLATLKNKFHAKSRELSFLGPNRELAQGNRAIWKCFMIIENVLNEQNIPSDLLTGEQSPSNSKNKSHPKSRDLSFLGPNRELAQGNRAIWECFMMV